MSKVLIIVQCRYTSARLRGKALYPLCGIPIVVFLLKRLQEGLPAEQYHIVLATTTSREDDILEYWGKTSHVDVVRGEEQDVLTRYLQCLHRYPASVIARVTADNPLTCPKILKVCVNAMMVHNADYVKPTGCPIGTGADIFTADVLNMMNCQTDDHYEREHINAFILNHPEKFKMYFLELHGKIARPDISLTIDTHPDWGKIQKLFSADEREPWKVSLGEIIERLD